MNSYNLEIAIASVHTYHLAFGGEASYWQDYGEPSDQHSALPNDRFEFKQGWQTVYASAVETPLVRVELDSGEVGWGESNTPIAPEIVCMIIDRAVWPMVAHRRFDNPTQLWDFMYDTQRGRGVNSGYWMDALAALDIAVWDALGKRNEASVASMIQESPRRTIPVYQSGLRQATLEERAEFANESVGNGVRGIKIFPTGSVGQMLHELDYLMQRCPDVDQWMVDALWMCDFDAAVDLKRHLGDRNARFLECPLQPELTAQHRELVAMPSAPIAIGEHFRTSHQIADWLTDPPAMDVYQPDIGRTGITDFIRQRDLAARAGVPTTPHMGNGVSIFQAATLQCAAVSSSRLLQEFQSGLSKLLSDATETAWVMQDGAFSLPSEPGIGVQVDESKLSAYGMPKSW